MRNITNAPFQSFWDSFPSQFHFFDEVTERGKRRNIRRLFGAPPSLRLLCAGENQRRGRKEPPATPAKRRERERAEVGFCWRCSHSWPKSPFPLSFFLLSACVLPLPSSPDSMDRISIKQSLNTILLPSLPPSLHPFFLAVYGVSGGLWCPRRGDGRGGERNQCYLFHRHANVLMELIARIPRW